MKKGDIIFVNNPFDPVGLIIRKWTHGKWNHVVWAINEKEILEVTGGGILISPIAKYYNKFIYRTEVRRIKGIDKKDLDRAIKWAKSNIKKGTYLKLWLSYFLILSGYKKELPRVSCSGLIAVSLSRENWYFKKNKNPHKITPEDIYRCKKLEERKNE